MSATVELARELMRRPSGTPADAGCQHLMAERPAAGGLNYDLTWRLSGQPFLTPAGELVAAIRVAITDVTGIDPESSTTGGTSDGRFIAPTGALVVEFGPINASIHQVDECVAVADLDALAEIDQGILLRLFATSVKERVNLCSTP